MKFLLRFSLLAVVASLLWSAPVLAQSIDPIIAAAVTRSNGFRSNDYEPYWISYDDCIKNDAFTFSVKVRNNTANNNLEVWAGADCTDQENRRADANTCWQVFRQQNTAVSQDAVIRVQTIAQKNYGKAAGDPALVGDANSCAVPTQQEALTLWFMLVGPNDDLIGQAVQTWTSTTLAVNLPAPPSSLSASGADEALALKWTPSADANRTGYRYFCQEAGTNTGTGALDGGVAPPCATDLVEGQRPPASVRECGGSNSRSASSGSISEEFVSNGVEYAVAVATTDAVLNIGVVTNVACATPVVTEDFFDLYRDAGGQAGGGVCSISPGSAGTPASALVVLLGPLALVLARRRRGLAS